MCKEDVIIGKQDGYVWVADVGATLARFGWWLSLLFSSVIAFYWNVSFIDSMGHYWGRSVTVTEFHSCRSTGTSWSKPSSSQSAYVMLSLVIRIQMFSFWPVCLAARFVCLLLLMELLCTSFSGRRLRPSVTKLKCEVIGHPVPVLNWRLTMITLHRLFTWPIWNYPPIRLPTERKIEFELNVDSRKSVIWLSYLNWLLVVCTRSLLNAVAHFLPLPSYSGNL